MIEYGANVSEEGFPESSYHNVLAPFARATLNIVDRLIDWGAQVGRFDISLHCGPLNTGETTFASDFNLHADSFMVQDDFIILRTLCVSSDPASFLDFTHRDEMKNIIERHRVPGTPRIFYPHLLSGSEDMGGKIITTECWDIIAFDGSTPHLPKGASVSNRRILMNGWVEVRLPTDWKMRIQNNDVPQWTPSL